MVKPFRTLIRPRKVFFNISGRFANVLAWFVCTTQFLFLLAAARSFLVSDR